MKGYEVLDRLSASPDGNIVFKAKRQSDGTVFAVKQISYAEIPKSDRTRVVDTTNTLIQLSRRTPEIVRYHNTQVDSELGKIYLIMDYFEAGSLEKLIRQSRKPIDTEQIWSIATDIALALYECHNNKPVSLAHGALSADHVFLDRDGSAKIGCFSLNSCAAVDKQKDLTDLGVLIYRMATLSPYESKRQISTSDSTFRHLDEGLRNILVGLLNPAHSDERFTLLNVLEFPEIALKVLEKKIKLESEMYEQEKQRFLAKEQELQVREKRLTAEVMTEAQ